MTAPYYSDESVPQDARSADSGTGGPPEPENAVQGRIGWLRMTPDDERRHLMREVPGGWTRIDTTDPNLVWSAKHLPDAEFTPIRTLADDEVAVKREDLEALIDGLGMPGGPPVRIAARLRAALAGGAA